KNAEKNIPYEARQPGSLFFTPMIRSPHDVMMLVFGTWEKRKGKRKSSNDQYSPHRALKSESFYTTTCPFPYRTNTAQTIRLSSSSFLPRPAPASTVGPEVDTQRPRNIVRTAVFF